MRRFFAKPAYYINALFALAVRINNTSSPCERWGHELKLLWDPQRTQPTSALIHRLVGRVFGLRGDGTDEAFLQVLHDGMMQRPTGYHQKFRNMSGRALATWRARQQLDYTQAPNRVLHLQDFSASLPAERQGCDFHRPEAEFRAQDLEVDDVDLLSRTRQRDRGTLAPGFANTTQAQSARTRGRRKIIVRDAGSTMPWCANTKSQWDRDLASTKKNVLTSERAVSFFLCRDQHRPPPPKKSPRSLSATSSSSTSSSSPTSSSTNHGETKSLAAPPASSTDKVVACTHTGGASRIHGLIGDVSLGSASWACKPSRFVSTCHDQIGEARTKNDAENATGSRWCKTCVKQVW